MFLLMFIYFGVQAQVVQHHSYKTYYNAAIKEADSVSWDLIPQMVACSIGDSIRVDKFIPDPLIKGCPGKKDYANSGFDKGHLFNFDDAVCSTIDQVECFYMSNMLPQYHPFNAGDWKVLEIQERVWAKVQKIHIVAGGFGTLGKLKAGENIPKYMWKAIYINGQYEVWIMPNAISSHGHKYDYWKTSIHKFDFKSIGDEIRQKGI